ncbi:MAG: GxxExxY protein [Verrucomicrobia bacterium]|nr:GxxExxY protein [Verrucomicrobiota bacterium]
MNDELLRKIVDAAIEVHKLLGGPGLLENIYESALCHELSLLGIPTQRQLPIPILYKGAPIRDPLFLDILVDKRVIVEVKANEKHYPYYEAQLLTHLRLTGIKLGLLINFGQKALKEGVIPIINNHANQRLG